MCSSSPTKTTGSSSWVTSPPDRSELVTQSHSSTSPPETTDATLFIGEPGSGQRYNRLVLPLVVMPRTQPRSDARRRPCSITPLSYFLRLPDGKRNGMGFASHDHQSLRKLRGKKIPVVNAVDASAAYDGWEDLTGTISNVIGPSSSDRDVVVHVNDPSIAANPHDHFDHRMAGLLVEDLRRTQRWKTQYYVGYALATRAANRSTDEAREKTAIFLAYDREMTRVNPKWSAYEEHPGFYSECMLRTYARKARPSNRR